MLHNLNMFHNMFSSIYTRCFILIIFSLIVYVSCYEMEAVRVCAYSHNPDKYSPNCYNCPNPVYPNALMACLNATVMPKNITYDGANCMEQNCKIPYPEPSQPESEPMFDLLTAFRNFLGLNTNLQLPTLRLARSISDNTVDIPKGTRRPKIHIIRQVSTYVNDPPTTIEFGEPEYDG